MANARSTSRAASTVETISIGQLAEQAGVTPETIRYYEREGVLPVPARSGAGSYRRYLAADAERLRFIRRARDLGFSLDEVRELLSLAGADPAQPCSDVNRIALAHLAQVDAKLGQLTALRAQLAAVIDECGGVVPLGRCRILEALGHPSER